MNISKIPFYDRFPNVVKAYLTVVQPTPDLEKVLLTGIVENGTPYLGDRSPINKPRSDPPWLRQEGTFKPTVDYEHIWRGLNAYLNDLGSGHKSWSEIDDTLHSSLQTGSFLSWHWGFIDNKTKISLMVLGEVQRPTADYNNILGVVRRSEVNTLPTGRIVEIEPSGLRAQYVWGGLEITL
ncbi:hypothetical protein HYV86_07240 [Candidatus Woesearchaeota archaeon]|nr:hypothetical protein [Candidatus Woesearchaeota archaeon]